MDNELSEDLKQYFEDSDVHLQLVTPHKHWRNSSEMAVRTSKNHFIAAPWTVEPIFPFYVWDSFLPQVTMILNMLRRSWLNPELSAYEQVAGIHHFEKTPLEPLGWNVQIHEKLINK